MLTPIIPETTSNIIYATTHATIALLDLRTMRILQTMENPRHYGPVTTLCIDRRKAWLVVGTITGVLTLWDLRFGLLIKSWRAGVTAPARSLRIHKCIVHPTKGRGRWIMVALEARPPVQASASLTDSRGTVLVEVWDIETTSLVETFETREVHSESSASVVKVDQPERDKATIVGEEAERNPAAAIAALVRFRTAGTENGSSGHAVVHNLGPESPNSVRPSPVWTQPDVCAMVGGSDFGGVAGAPRGEFGNVDKPGEDERSLVKTGGRGFILTGSEDRKIRLWDLNWMDRSVVLSGGEVEGERPTYK